MIEIAAPWHTELTGFGALLQSSVEVPSALVLLYLLIGIGLAVVGVAVGGGIYYLTRESLPSSARRKVLGTLVGGAVGMGAGVPVTFLAPFALPGVPVEAGVGVFLGGASLFLGAITYAVARAMLRQSRETDSSIGE